MINKSYRLVKNFFYIILLGLILMFFYFINNILYYLVNEQLTFKFIFSNIFEIINYSFFTLILFFFLMLLSSIEKDIFSKQNIKYSKIIARFFMAITILEFIYINTKIDSTGIGLSSFDIDKIVIFSAFNYLVFSIFVFIFKKLQLHN